MDNIYEKLCSKVTRKIPNTSHIIIMKDGEIINNIKTTPIKDNIDDSEIKFIAELIKLRYHIVDFHKVLSGLEMTINIFREHCIFVTSLDETVVLIIITRDVNTENTRQVISNIRSEYGFK